MKKIINFVGCTIYFAAMFPLCIISATIDAVSFQSWRVFANSFGIIVRSIFRTDFAKFLLHPYTAVAAGFIAAMAIGVLCTSGAFAAKQNGYVAKCEVVADSVTVCDCTTYTQEQIAIKVCKTLLDECRMAGVLDDAGLGAYNEINKQPCVDRYIELINECMAEDDFWDIVAEGDAYCDYQTFVLAYVK